MTIFVAVVKSKLQLKKVNNCEVVVVVVLPLIYGV